MLFSFTEQTPTASARELAERLAIPVPSVHRYIAMLRDMGLIEEGQRGRYHLTMRVTALGRAARQATPIVDLAEPYMRRLAGQTGESVLLERMVGGHPMCVHLVETPTWFRLLAEPGQRLPLLRGAGVRVLLGSMTPAERERYVDAALESGARPPVLGREEFLREVERVIQCGWSTSRDEIDEGMWAASAAVCDEGEVVATLTLLCLAAHVDDERRELIIDLVRKAAADVSHALDPGYADVNPPAGGGAR